MESLLLFLVSILIVASIAVFFIKKFTPAKENSLASEDTDNDGLAFLQSVQFNQKKFMTDTEKKFFQTLTQAVQGFYIFPQVATHSILSCSSNNYSYRTKAFNMFKSTAIDYVICDQNFKVVAIIELDDRTHKGKEEKDKKRDMMLHNAGYKAVRFNCEKEYSLDYIRDSILN